MFNQVNLIVYKQSLTSFKETIESSFKALIQGIRNGLSTTFYLLGCQSLSLKVVDIQSVP